MAKEIVDKQIESLRKLLGTKKIIIGTEKTIKALKSGKIEKVYLASNCEANAAEKIKYSCKLAKADFVKLDYPNDELGTLCKKPFSISVIGFLKEKPK